MALTSYNTRFSMSHTRKVALSNLQMANCLRTQTRVPVLVRQLSKSVGAYRSEENIQAEGLSELMAKVCDLVADVRGNGIPDLMKVIQRAHDIDVRMHAWSLNLSSRWNYTTHSSSASRSPLYHKTCGSSYHLYPGIWACNIWSYYRTGRILLNLLLRDRLGPLVDTAPEWARSAYDEAKVNITRLSMDILLSVPYSMSLQFSSTEEEVGINSHTPAGAGGGYLGGYSILWPLYVAASVSAPGSRHRDWAIDRLEYIGHRMGIGQSLLMARVVSSEIPHELLSIYDYCQSYRPNL